MCIICSEWQKGKMTSQEALANIGEMLDSGQSEEEVKHLFELADKVIDKEQPFEEWDNDSQTGILDELDKAFGDDDECF